MRFIDRSTCDVSSDEQIEGGFRRFRPALGRTRQLVHSVAYAPREALEGAYVDAVTRSNFAIATTSALLQLHRPGQGWAQDDAGAVMVLC